MFSALSCAPRALLQRLRTLQCETLTHASTTAAPVLGLALLQRWKLMKETSWEKPSIPSASRQVSENTLHLGLLVTPLASLQHWVLWPLPR